MGSWLRGIEVEGRSLVIPGHPDGHAADVVLTFYGIELWARIATAGAGTASAELDWDEYGMGLERFKPKPDGWVVGQWIAYRDPVGVGINTSGVCAALTQPVWEATASTLRNRAMTVCFMRGRPAHAIPLCAVGRWSDATPGRERDTFSALCTVLAEREALRPRLEDPDTLRRLAHDLATIRRRAIPETLGLRRKTTEIMRAMQALGYEHKLFGRPVAGDALPSLEEATDRVAELLEANPYTSTMIFRRQYIEAVVNERYLQIKPWPFAALTQ